MLDNAIKIIKYNHNDIGELIIVTLGVIAIYMLIYTSCPLEKKEVEIFKNVYYRPFVNKKLNIFMNVILPVSGIVFYIILNIFLWSRLPRWL